MSPDRALARARHAAARIAAFINAESGAHAHPAMHAKMLVRFLVVREHARTCPKHDGSDLIRSTFHHGLLPGPRVFIVQRDDYVCLVPFVENEKLVY